MELIPLSFFVITGINQTTGSCAAVKSLLGTTSKNFRQLDTDQNFVPRAFARRWEPCPRTWICKHTALTLTQAIFGSILRKDGRKSSPSFAFRIGKFILTVNVRWISSRWGKYSEESGVTGSNLTFNSKLSLWIPRTSKWVSISVLYATNKYGIGLCLERITPYTPSTYVS